MTTKPEEDGIGWVIEWKKKPCKGRVFWKPIDCGIFDEKAKADNACIMRSKQGDNEFRVRRYVRAGR